MPARAETKPLSEKELNLDQEILVFIGEFVGQYIGEDKSTKPAQGYETVRVNISTAGLNTLIKRVDITQNTWRTEFNREEIGQWAVRGETTTNVPDYPDRPSLQYLNYADGLGWIEGWEALEKARLALGMQKPQEK